MAIYPRIESVLPGLSGRAVIRWNKSTCCLSFTPRLAFLADLLLHVLFGMLPTWKLGQEVRDDLAWFRLGIRHRAHYEFHHALDCG